MIDGDVIVLLLLAAVLVLLCWITWLYILAFKRCRMLEVDNYRLMRRLGMYHSISLGTPNEDIVPQAPDQHSIPAFFRNRVPQPPVGWHPPGKFKDNY